MQPQPDESQQQQQHIFSTFHRAELAATDFCGIFCLRCQQATVQSDAHCLELQTPSRWWRSKADVNTSEGVARVRWICLSLLLQRYDWPNEIYGELGLSFSYITHTLAGAHNPLWNCPQTRSLGWMVARADVPDNRASLSPSTQPHPPPPPPTTPTHTHTPSFVNAMLQSRYTQWDPVMPEHVSFASSAWRKTFQLKCFRYC